MPRTHFHHANPLTSHLSLLPHTQRVIWSVGLLAAANASTVTSTYAGQMIMDGFMDWRVSVWWRTSVVRLITLGPTLLIAILLRGQDPSFDTLTEWLNIIQSLVLPFVVIPLLLITASDRIMGAAVNRLWFTGVWRGERGGVLRVGGRRGGPRACEGGAVEMNEASRSRCSLCPAKTCIADSNSHNAQSSWGLPPLYSLA